MKFFTAFILFVMLASHGFCNLTEDSASATTATSKSQTAEAQHKVDPVFLDGTNANLYYATQRYLPLSAFEQHIRVIDNTSYFFKYMSAITGIVGAGIALIKGCLNLAEGNIFSGVCLFAGSGFTFWASSLGLVKINRDVAKHNPYISKQIQA